MTKRPVSLYRAVVTGVIGLAAAGLMGLAAPASASAPDKPGANPDSGSSATVKPVSRANKDGVCNTNELCLYYFQGRAGAKLDLYSSDSNFFGDILKGGGSGTGSSADNNTRSFYSAETSVYWRVYDGANYSGQEILCIAPGDRGNFTQALWDKASSARYSSTAC